MFLHKALQSVSHKWRKLAQVLGYSDQKLDEISTRPTVNIGKECFQRILNQWMKSPFHNMTIEDASLIIRALKGIGEAALAEELRSHPCKLFSVLFLLFLLGFLGGFLGGGGGGGFVFFTSTVCTSFWQSLAPLCQLTQKHKS